VRGEMAKKWAEWIRPKKKISKRKSDQKRRVWLFRNRDMKGKK
jgi:hypothetical protein